MKRTILSIAVLSVLMILFFTGAALAAKPGTFTIDVRNTTGKPVEFNYRGEDGITHWVTLPAGVSQLTIAEGVYSYWADPPCGHVAGTFNLDAALKVLWVSCKADVPGVNLVKLGLSHCDYGIFQIGLYDHDWDGFVSWDKYSKYLKWKTYEIFAVNLKDIDDIISIWNSVESPFYFYGGCYDDSVEYFKPN